jgi:hypothetical protein
MSLRESVASLWHHLYAPNSDEEWVRMSKRLQELVDPTKPNPGETLSAQAHTEDDAGSTLRTLTTVNVRGLHSDDLSKNSYVPSKPHTSHR